MGFNPTLVYTGMLLHSIQLRFCHPYYPASAASTASAASVVYTPSAASVASSLVLHHNNSHYSPLFLLFLCIPCLCPFISSFSLALWLPFSAGSSTSSTLAYPISYLLSCLLLRLHELQFPLSIQAFQYSQDTYNQWTCSSDPPKNTSSRLKL